MVSRGEVCWLELAEEGRRPVCVLTRDEAVPRLRNVVVALLTGRVRGLGSEVVLGPDDGMPRESAIGLDNLRTVPKALLTEPITELAPASRFGGAVDLPPQPALADPLEGVLRDELVELRGDHLLEVAVCLLTGYGAGSPAALRSETRSAGMDR